MTPIRHRLPLLAALAAGVYLSGLIIVLVLCVGVSGYVGLRQSRRMLRDIAEPLQQLARVAHAVRHDRSMDQRVPLARPRTLDMMRTPQFYDCVNRVRDGLFGRDAEPAEHGAPVEAW